MKTTKPLKDERGFAHLGLIVLAILVIAVGAFAYTRVKDAQDKDNTTSSSQTAASDDEAKSAASLEQSDSKLQSTPTDTSAKETASNDL